MLLFAANEFIYNNISPELIKFKRCACYDTGVACGGFGQIIMELSVTTLESLQLSTEG